MYYGIHNDLPCDEVPGTITDEVIWIFPNRSLQHFSPVLQVFPGLLNCSPCERWEAGQRFKLHTTQTPIIDGKLIFITLQDLRSHVVRGAHNRLGVVDIS